MLISIIKREFQDNLFSFRFSVTLIICLVLFLTSAYLMSSDYQRRLEHYSAARSEQKDNKINERLPIPLSVLAKGLDNSMGYDQRHNPLFSVFDSLDFMYIVKVALSLMAIFFSFGVISGEKEAGTLALTMSNSVSRSKVILGKWIGNYAALMVPFLIAVIIELLMINLSDSINTEDEVWIRMGLIILLSLVYISVFFGLGVFISVVTQKASTSLILSLMLWAVLILAVPSMAVLVSKRAVDAPSTQEVRLKKQAIRQAANIETTRKLEENSISDPKERQKVRDESWKRINEEHKKLDDERKLKLRHLVSITKDISRISPSSSYVFAVTTLARTGIEDRQSYDDIAEKDVEEANRNRKDLAESTKVALPDIALLLIINVLLFMGAYVAFMRYDVRLR
jgi:ABC-type transport system involved in multi-copper enzyme maturation permease subunit